MSSSLKDLHFHPCNSLPVGFSEFKRLLASTFHYHLLLPTQAVDLDNMNPTHSFEAEFNSMQLDTANGSDSQGQCPLYWYLLILQAQEKSILTIIEECSGLEKSYSAWEDMESRIKEVMSKPLPLSQPGNPGFLEGDEHRAAEDEEQHCTECRSDHSTSSGRALLHETWEQISELTKKRTERLVPVSAFAERSRKAKEKSTVNRVTDAEMPFFWRLGLLGDDDT